MKAAAGLLLAFLLAAGSAQADLADGVEKLKKGEYEAAFYEFLPLAEQGDANAQLLLGTMYSQGKGVPNDLGEARKWYLRAALQNNPAAQFALGDILAQGKGVTMDLDEALVWFRRAANQGHVHAINNLGFAYASGTGVERDPVQAANWFRKGAQAGDVNALYNLALAYQNGSGVPIDPVRAHLYFNLAAARGDRESATARDEIARSLKPDQLKAAQTLFQNWKPDDEAVPAQAAAPAPTPNPVPAPPPQTAPLPPSLAALPTIGAPAANLPPPPPPVAVAPPSPATPAASWHVRIAQGVNQQDVARQAGQIRNDNADLLRAQRLAVLRQPDKSYQARLGPFEGRDIAERLCAALAARKVACQLVEGK
ncbi:MAG: sel1 repeat family protein [Rhodospirillales bacterium]|nr:sel1 repeat family protein [Rhodospirillales bacterium]